MQAIYFSIFSLIIPNCLGVDARAEGVRPRSSVAARRAYRSSQVRPMAVRSRVRSVTYTAHGSRVLPPSRPAPPAEVPAPPPVSDEGPRTEPSRPRAPHGMGLSGAYAYEKPNPPPPPEALAPKPLIGDEYLSRMAAQSAPAGVSGAAVRATRPDRIGKSNGDADTEILVLDGTAPGGSSGGGGVTDGGTHNRDQGGKPEGGGKGKGKS